MIDSVLMQPGQWSLRLSPDTPLAVREKITPFSNVVILPGAPAELTTAQLYAASMWTGVVLRPGPQWEIGGAGQAWWLGDADGQAHIITAAQSIAHYLGGASTATWAADIARSWMSVGTTDSGNHTGGYMSVTWRQALQAIADDLGFEWRLRPNWTLDLAAASTIWGSSPVAVVTARRDALSSVGGLPGLAISDLTSTVDYEGFASSVTVRGDVWGASGGASTYRDPDGNLITIIRVFDAPEAGANPASVAANLVAALSDPHREIRLTADRYDLPTIVEPGHSVWVWDPDRGFVDTANPVAFAGATIWPVSMRVVGVRWPVQQGMGVVHIHHESASEVITDLTPWIEWETGSAELVVGAAPRSLVAGSVSSASVGTVPAGRSDDAPWTPYTPAWTVTSGTNPVIGNGTIEGSYRVRGTTCHVRGRIVGGSTTTWGVGNYRVSLPYTAATDYDGAIVARLQDATAGRWSGSGIVETGASTMLVHLLEGSAAIWSNSSPIATPTTSDNLVWAGTYEIDL